MVKLEDSKDSEDSSNGVTGLNFSLAANSSGLKPCSVPMVVKEESLPSSSSNHLKSHLIGMGFSSILIDKVIEENGEDDVNVLLEALLVQSHEVHQKSSPSSESQPHFSGSIKEEDSSPFDFGSDDDQENKDRVAPSDDMEKRSYLLMMDFTEEEIDLAITRLGGSSSLGELIDFIIASQIAGSCREKEMLGSVNECNGNNNEESTTDALFGTMEKTLCLLQMGFTENEVSSAVAKIGSDAPINELADSILASRLAFQVKEEDMSNTGIHFTPEELSEFEQLGCAKEEYPGELLSRSDPWLKSASPSNNFFDDSEDKRFLKKAKLVHAEEKSNSYRRTQWQTAGRFECQSSRQGSITEFPEFSGSTEASSVKEELPDYVPRKLTSDDHDIVRKSPFFYYGNVVDVSQETWRKLSQFVYGIQPEFVDSQFFSALIRKEGYLHNLPVSERFHVLPKGPVTIEAAMPHTKKWWPSWDTRKQLSCINSKTSGVSQLCDRLGRMMAASNGMVSTEQQTDILHHCKALNLIWIGPNKLCPIEPEDLEHILGYPKHHTDVLGLELADRLTALKYSFQTDTIGYHFSVLKSIYPNGLRLLSVCSGIGGAEIALHRLGIRLRCVVSVEASESNRKTLKQWWNRTGQSGELRQIAGSEKLTIRHIEGLVKEFGGFDIIIGGNSACRSPSSSSRENLVGMDLNHFYEFTRVLQRVRSLMGRNMSSGEWRT